MEHVTIPVWVIALTVPAIATNMGFIIKFFQRIKGMEASISANTTAIKENGKDITKNEERLDRGEQTSKTLIESIHALRVDTLQAIGKLETQIARLIKNAD